MTSCVRILGTWDAATGILVIGSCGEDVCVVVGLIRGSGLVPGDGSWILARHGLPVPPCSFGVP